MFVNILSRLQEPELTFIPFLFQNKLVNTKYFVSTDQNVLSRVGKCRVCFECLIRLNLFTSFLINDPH